MTISVKCPKIFRTMPYGETTKPSRTSVDVVRRMPLKKDTLAIKSVCASLTWSLRKYTKVVRKKSEDTDKQTIRIREHPIRETAWKHDRLKVPKLGEVKIYMHRPLRGDPKEVTLVKKASGWYAHISCDIEDTAKVEPTEAIGVDMGTAHYLMTSEGEKLRTHAGIAKQKAYSESTLKTCRVRKKAAIAGRNNNTNSLYTRSEQQTDVKTLSVNSSTNSTTITRTTSS